MKWEESTHQSHIEKRSNDEQKDSKEQGEERRSEVHLDGAEGVCVCVCVWLSSRFCGVTIRHLAFD